MQQTLTKKTSSSYIVTLTVDAKDRDALHQKTLISLQKEVKVQGFRQGHVPLHMVEKQVQPEYLNMAFMEEVINQGIKTLVKDHTDIHFIGQPYDLQPSDTDGKTVITFTLDTYPEVDVVNADWKKLSMAAIATDVTDTEVAQAVLNLQKQYAEYKDTDTVINTTLIKATYRMLGKDGAELHKGSSYCGQEEFAESAFLFKAVEGAKKGDTVTFDYKEDKLPHAVHYHPHGSELSKQIKTVEFTIIDCKETVLPDITDEATLQKLFQTPDIKTKADLDAKVRDVLVEQKEEQGLQKSVEDMLVEARKSLTVTIPETILREEMGARIKTLGDRMGGEAGLKQYFEKIGEQKTNEMYDEIRTSAKDSLEKFFVLRKLVELLEITDIDWNAQLDAEKKIYARLGSGTAKKAPAKKALAKETTSEETTEDVPAKLKKAPAKKKKDEAAE
jgi:trigger factor